MPQSHNTKILISSSFAHFITMKGFLFLLFLTFPFLLIGQYIDGTWEGTITLERPGPKKEYKFELVLKKQGKDVIGTSYIYYKEEEPVAMNLAGWFYHDRSMWLLNKEVLYPEFDSNKDRHIRKYQLMYRRSAFSPDVIEGHWQEKNDPIFSAYRKGKVYLMRKKSEKSKA